MQKPDYIIDNQKRLQKIVYPDKRIISFSYDDTGNLIKADDTALGSIICQYDQLERLKKITLQNAKVLSYDYDRIGNRRRVTYPNGEVTFYNYDNNNRLTEVNSSNGKTHLEYDKVGRIVKKIFPNGIVVNYTYNAYGRLARLITTDPNNYILSDVSYNIDAVGNYNSIINNVGDSDKKSNFIYDPLYRLIGIECHDGYKIKYKYDSIGNRLSLRTSSISANGKTLGFLSRVLRNIGIFLNKVDYKYDSTNQLIKAGETEFKYDEEGNLIEKKVNNKITRYVYDFENRITKIEYPDGSYSQYTYDALGRRIGKRYPNGKTVSYLYDGHNLIQEINDKGHVTTNYIYGLSLDHPVSMTVGGETYYYLYDHLGSVIALTDESGKVTAEYEYDVWGNTVRQVGDIENPFRFTGREWDAESGLYYYRVRYYDPIIGRFISRNPSPGLLTNPQSFNKYTYTFNNPLSYVDPFGISATKYIPEENPLKNIICTVGTTSLRSSDFSLDRMIRVGTNVKKETIRRISTGTDIRNTSWGGKMKRTLLFTLSFIFILANAYGASAKSLFDDQNLKNSLFKEDWNEIVLKSSEWKQIEGNCIPYILTGYAYIYQGEYNKAIAELSCKSNPESQEKFFAWIQGFLNEKPDSALGYILRGDYYARTGKYDLAVIDFTKSLSMKNNLVIAYEARGIIYTLDKKYDLAMSDFNKVIELTPLFADAYSSRGILNILMAKYDMANVDFSEALNLKPDYALAYNGRGVAYLLDGKYDPAIEDFTKSLQINPVFSEANVNREIAYLIRAKKLFTEDLANAMEITPAGVLQSVCIGITGINSVQDDLAGHWAKPLFGEKSFSSYIFTHEGSPLGKIVFGQKDKYPNVIMLPQKFNEKQIESAMNNIFAKAKAEGKGGISITLDPNLGLGYLMPGIRKGEMEYTAKVADKVLGFTKILAPGVDIKEVVHSAGSGPVLYQQGINNLSSLVVLSGRYSDAAWGNLAKQHSSVQIMLGSGDRDFPHFGKGYEVVAKNNPNVTLFNYKSGSISLFDVHSALANPSTTGEFNIYGISKVSKDYSVMTVHGTFGDIVGVLTQNKKPQGAIPGYYTSPDRPLAEVNIMSNMALNQGWKKIGVVGAGSDDIRANMLVDNLKKSGAGVEVVSIPLGSPAIIQQTARNLGVDGMVGLKPQTMDRKGVLINTPVVRGETADLDSLFTQVEGGKIDARELVLKYPFLLFNVPATNP